MQRAVLRDGRDLEIEIRPGMQIRDRAELGALGLVLIELCRIEGRNRNPVDRADAAERRLAGIVWDLKMRVELAEHRADLVVRVDDLFEIGEAVALLRAVMDLVVFRRNAVDAMVALQIVARDKIVAAVDRAAVFRARIESGVAATIHSNGAARREKAAVSLDIDDAGGPQTVFRGQGAGDQLR